MGNLLTYATTYFGFAAASNAVSINDTARAALSEEKFSELGVK